MRLNRAAATVACALALSLAACDDNGTTSPTMQSVAGTYVATQFITTTNGVATNQLSAGSTLTLTLNGDGTTSGTLFVPAFGQAQLDGTWGFLDNHDIDLNSDTDTFLRDMLLTVAGNALIGDQTFNSTRIQVVLTKQ